MFRRIRNGGVVPQDGNGDVEAQEVDEPLARAWFEKRKQQLESQSNQNKATAVDVDAVPTWETNDPADNKNTQPNHYIINDNDSLGASAQSILTDRTPVVSNMRPGFKRKATERSLLPSLASVITNNNNGELSCGDVFDISKWHGKVLYGLIILLLLSIVTVIATALLSGRGDRVVPSVLDSVSLEDVPTVSPAMPPLTGTVAPVATASPTITAPPSPASIPDVSILSSATFPPTLSPVTIPATFQPTAQPTPSSTISLSGLVGSLAETYRIPANSRAATLSGNGRVLAVVHAQQGIGAHNVTVYELGNDNEWRFRSANAVGETAAVALSNDGNIMAISAPFESVPSGDGELENAGRVQVFLYDLAVTYRPLGAELRGKTIGGFFGHSLALSYTGLTIAVGAPLFVASTEAASSMGEVQVFDFSTTQLAWLPVGNPLRGMEAEDWFGSSISIAQDAPDQGSAFSVRPTTIAISAPHSRETGGYVHVYQYVGQDWQMVGRERDISNKDVDPTLPFDFEDEFGTFFLSLVPIDENYRLVVGCPRKDSNAQTEDSGMVAVYEYNTYDTRWELLGAPILSSTPKARLGQSGQLLDNGKLLVTGEPGANNDKGLIRFYRFDGTDFTTEGDETVIEGEADFVEFGKSVDASRKDDDRLVVAAVATSGEYSLILEQQL